MRFVLASLAISLSAQTPTGSITGRILDSTGAAVPAAAIRAINLSSNTTAPTASNAQGNFELRNLIPGAYRIEIERAGFKRYDRERVEVRVGDVLALDITLEVGNVSERVTVTAETPLLEAANASVGQVIDNRRITDLPTPGGSVIYMMQTVPSVTVTTAPTNLWPPDALGSAGGTSIAGSPGGSNEFQMDGTPMMTRSGGFTFNPPPEMVQEFRVQTAAFDASVGRILGAQVNMVMKSGTNRWNGTLVYENLSRGLIARDIFTNNFIHDTRTGPITSEKVDRAWPSQRVARYRGTTGGPLYIPKVHDGRNRTFWTFGLDVVQRQRASRGSYTVPTDAQREGNFAALLALGAQYQIFDPSTIAAAPNGRFSRLPFAGNILPASRIDPIARRMLEFWARPNTAGARDGADNYTDPNLANSPHEGYLGRADQYLNDRHRLFGSFYYTSSNPISDQYFHTIATGTIRNRRVMGLSLDDTYTLRPNLLLNLRYGLTRYKDPTRHPSQGIDLASLGFAPQLTALVDRNLATLPAVTISGTTGVGGTSGQRPITTYHSASGTATQLRGNHSLRFGGEFRVLQENVANFGNATPALTFGTTYTNGPLDNSPGAPVGQGLAAFLLGRVTGGGIDRNATTSESSRYVAGFVQDDWKVTRGLTVNAGLRYEYEAPTVERFNRSTRGFDFGSASPIDAAARANYARAPISEVPVSGFAARGGLMFVGAGGQPRGYLNAERNNVSPRLGIAWQATPNTVVRTGFGIFVEPRGSDRIDSGLQGFSRRTAIVPTLDNGLSFRANFANPLPDGALAPLGAEGGLSTFLGQGVSFTDPARRAGYAQRWTFDIQRELPHRILVSGGYLGNKAVGLGTTRDLNPAPAQYLSNRPVRDDAVINFLSQQVRNPFAGIDAFTGTGLQAANVARSQLLRPFPHFTGLSVIEGGGSTWYHAFQGRVEKRFSSGYTMQLSYTWSKLMEALERLNPTDTGFHEVVSSLDRAHSLSINGIYELPVFRANRWLDRMLGGWSLQGLYQMSSGFPLSWGNIIFNGDIKNITLPRSQRRLEQWFNVNAGFERDARFQLASNIRTFPLRLNNVRADGVHLLNASVIKNFRLRETLRLQFRAEAIDVTNNRLYSTPNLTPTSGAFGTITTLGAGNTQRRVTLVGRVIW